MRASSLPLLTKCAGSACLTQGEEEKSDAAQEGADWGDMVHGWKQHGRVEHPSKRMVTAFLKALELSGADPKEMWPEGGKHEQAVALRVDGIREAEWNDAHLRDGQPAWITGTDDFQWWLFDGELWIDDLKTGKYYPNPPPGCIGHMRGIEVGDNRYPQDVRSAQLRFYALAAATLLGYAGSVHVSLTHWPRLPLEHRHRHPVRYWTTYSAEELTSFWGDLERLHEEVHRGALVLRPGDHCRFCPARNNCFEAKEFN